MYEDKAIVKYVLVKRHFHYSSTTLFICSFLLYLLPSMSLGDSSSKTLDGPSLFAPQSVSGKLSLWQQMSMNKVDDHTVRDCDQFIPLSTLRHTLVVIYLVHPAI